MTKWLWVLVIVLVAGVGFFLGLKFVQKERIVLDGSEFACKTDSDCVRVDASFCGCSAGGTATAINSRYVGVWNDKKTADGKGMMCFGVMSKDWTCFASVKCVSGKCTLTK